METRQAKLTARLTKIWAPPDFVSFFSLTNRKPYRIKKGTLLFSEGEPLEKLYFIKVGFVKLYRLSEDGRDTTSYLFGPGYILGIRALTSKDHCARHNAEAITDLEVMSMSHKEYFATVAAHPEYVIDLLYVFMDRLNYTERKLEGFIITDVTARVANFLANFAERFCPQSKEEITLPVQLTHQQIAELVGSFRETVTVALHKLEKAGVVQTHRGTIRIKNLQKLQEYATHKKKA